ncbi:O-acyltransferase [Bacteroidia bacterium]|nr:O-acyltransferase [Bacteroidia bacterium]GHT48080.1 O-acyltransferase [Bacteroidia bacterium]
MFFNSLDFALFLPIVFILYWFVTNKNLKIQNILLVVASYFFYGWWDWRFLFLLLFSTLTDYLVGLGLLRQENQKTRKRLLWISMLTNIGFLGFFKYYNFFVAQFVDTFSFFGYPFHPQTLHIILPVGISFYTFQTMSYVIDVYKRKLEPTKDFISFAAFVAFFPQLVAGPIERATQLLPQFYVKRTFDYSKAVDGMRQMLWGFFKKIVIADNCAQIVDKVYDNYQFLPGSVLLIGAIFFSVQIYCDFSGYSDIAIGCSRLFGFNLMRNFAYPYFSRDIAEFWRHWHISLTTWFKDYVYIPLGGSRGSLGQTIRNTFIIYLVSGFWHGANWTFIVWGLINAIYFLPLLLTHKNRKYVDVIAPNSLFPNLKELTQMLSTFLLATLAWIFFRSDNITQALQYIKRIFSSSLFSKPQGLVLEPFFLIYTVFFVVFLFIVEWIQRKNQHGLQQLPEKRIIRYLIYLLLALGMFFLGGSQKSFIYFQF